MNFEKNRFKRRLKYIYFVYIFYRLSWILLVFFCLFEIIEFLEIQQLIIFNGNMIEKRLEDSLKRWIFEYKFKFNCCIEKFLIFKFCFIGKLSYYGGI